MRSSMLVALGAALLWVGATRVQAEEVEPASQENPAAESAQPDPIESSDAGQPTRAPEGAAAVGTSEPVTPDAAASGKTSAAAEAAGTAEPEPMMEASELQPAAAADPVLGAEEEAASVTMATPEPQDASAAPASGAAENGVRLGQVGYDAEGREGRIHVVVRGDTLWDISDAYLGTPWVWPSIWQDNRGIENPHRIYPGDRIWITDGVMRVVTREEAEALLAGSPAAHDPAPLTGEESFEPPIAPAPALAAEPRTWRVSTREGVGFVTADAYESAASVVDSDADKVMLSQGDRVYIGLGAGDVVRGDQYTVFRKRERVFDPDSGRLLGYHVDLLGWLEVEEPGPEAALALIRKSDSEIERGDRVVRREEPRPEIAILPPPRGIEAKISFFAKSRTMMGMSDYVYLNRGTLDGIEVGSPLEVYRPAYVADEVARHTQVEVPDRVIAQLLVVKSDTNSAVAFVTQTHDELALGDHVRGATR